MPREYIVGEDKYPEDLQEEPWQVAVGWDRNGSVQVATTNPNAELGSLESGLYIELGRTRINELIRLLRKARDQAFGRDE